MNTPKDWIQKIRQRSQQIGESGVLFDASTSTMAVMQERIWGRGELTNGSKLKYKEDYELYIYKPPFPNRPNGKGKPNADGKQRKIKGQSAPSYLAAKDTQNRKDLPFELTGDMRIAWLGGPRPTPKLRAGGLLCEITMPTEQFKKAEGLAKQKGDFLELTDAEKKHQDETLARLINDIFQ